jgi:death-on-curing protein
VKRKEPRWPARHSIEIIHQNQLIEHGGLPGVRDGAALESALARARQRFACGDAPDIARLTAAYGIWLACKHPFNDGNKPLAFIAMDLFAGLNGCAIETSEEDVVVTMLALAAGALPEAALAEWLRGRLVRMVGRPK